jgi:hypothetical protein
MKRRVRERARGARDAWASFRVKCARGRRAALGELASLPSGAVQLTAQPIIANCIVFSKDRAMQLDACLRSIERYAPYAGSITVICLASNADFAEAYRDLGIGERVRLLHQSDDFRRDVIGAIDADVQYTVFHTDDNVFFRRPLGVPSLPNGFATFSLRLGENTTDCYTLDRPQRLPRLSAAGSLIAWDWTRAEGDFAYPMSLDGHVFDTCHLLWMLRRARFTNPNGLEAELHYRRYLAPPVMLAFRESSLLSIPANLVNSTHENRTSGNPALSAEALNARFLDGDRIQIDQMDFAAVRAAHQEVPFVFSSRAV